MGDLGSWFIQLLTFAATAGVISGLLPGDDDGWKALPSNLVSEVLSFPQRIKSANSIIKSAFEFAEQDDAVQETTEQCVMLGSRAWDLASRLRTAFAFAPLKLEFPFHTVLLEKLPTVRERRKAFGSQDGDLLLVKRPKDRRRVAVSSSVNG